MTEQPKRKPGRPRKERPEDDKFNGAPEAAFDHDGDGSPGGSLPGVAGPADADDADAKRAKPIVNYHEQTAIVREAWEAYDMQDDRVRFDSAGRKWVFRMDNSTGFWELSLHLSRGLHEADEAVSQVVLGSSSGYEAVEKAVKRLDGAVK